MDSEFIPKPAGEDDRVAMNGEDQGGKAVGPRGIETESEGEWHRREGLGGIEFSAQDFLADRRPADFAGESDG
jgi:hypothetical protein